MTLTASLAALALVCGLTASPTPSPLDGGWTEAIDAGKPLTEAEVDAKLRTLEVAEIRAAIDQLESRLGSPAAPVRLSAQNALEHARLFPSRDLARLASESISPAGEAFQERSLRSLAVLEHAGYGDSLATLNAWVKHAHAAEVSHHLRAPIGQTALAILDRDPGSTRWFISAYDSVPDPFVSTWIDVLRKRSTAEDFSLAYELLGRRKQQDFLVLNRMNALRRALREPVNNTRLLGLRRYLTDMDARSRAEAATLLASLKDRKSIPLMIPLVGDSAAPVRRAAHASLKELTGMRFGSSPGRWKSWFKREKNWWKSEGQDLVRGMETLPLPELLDSLNEVTQHALYRHELGPAVAKLLDHRNETVVLMALSALESIHAQGQVQGVRKLLLDRRTNVASQARAVYATLSGETAPQRSTPFK